jgi:hypothetical protein
LHSFSHIHRVYSPAAQWAEWFVTVPYLSYIALAVERKVQMSSFDQVQLGLLVLMIFTGFLLNIPMPFIAAVFLLVICFGCLLTVTCLTVWNFRKIGRECGVHKLRMASFFLLKQRKRKAQLLQDLLLIMWHYPIVWVLGAVGVLDLNYTFAAYVVGSIFGKVIFSTLVVESHTQLLYEFLLLASSKTDLSTQEYCPTTPKSNQSYKVNTINTISTISSKSSSKIDITVDKPERFMRSAYGSTRENSNNSVLERDNSSSTILEGAWESETGDGGRYRVNTVDTADTVATADI